MNSVDITVGLPVYYGAKISDVEKCLDSLYTACEKIDKQYKNKIVNFLIGIDNCPKKFDKDYSVQKNKDEIKNRIEIFKEAIKNLNNKFTVNSFITENNVRVSVMRNIMISKTQNSKFTTFIDHDDAFNEEAFNIIFKQIEKNSNSQILYFKSINLWTKSEPIFEYLAPWSVLYNPKYLLNNNITFIPDIPLEDRFFRRECEIYAVDEDLKDIDDFFYLHSREGRSGLLPNDILELIRQELFKHAAYMGLKLKNYTIIKKGFDETYYKEYIFHFNNNQKDKTLIFKTINNDKIIDKNTANDFRFTDGKKLNKYQKDNHYTFCKIFYNDEEETYCRGYLTDKSFNNNINIQKINNYINLLEYNADELVILLKFLDDYFSIEEFNKIIENVSTENAKKILINLIKKREDFILKLIDEKNYIELEKILNNQDKNIDLSFINYNQINDEKIRNIINDYLFNVAYNAINTENTIVLQNILNQYPNIINLYNKENKINLSNLACRKQVIQDVENNENFAEYFKFDNNKIIAFLLKNYPESFLIKDIYDKCALDFLLIEYLDELKFNNTLSQDNVNLFFKNSKILSETFNEEFYKIIPYFRFIFKEKITEKNKEKILANFNQIKNNYLKNELIGFNIINFYKNNKYDLLTKTLIKKQSVTGSSILLPNYIKYTTFKNIFEYKDERKKSILDYTKENEKFNNFIREFLISTIWMNFLDCVYLDPINEYNIIRTEETLDILFDKNNNFKEYKINFKEYLDEFVKKSTILTNEKIAQELYNKINIKKDSLIKKEQNKFNKINSKEIPNFDKILNLFNDIGIILQSTEKDENKIKKFLQLIKNKYFTENN